MGTLVQAPERASVEVSGLQAIASPTGKGGGLGTFLSGILPAINQELDNYDKSSKDRLRALGQNDKLNNVMNEVSFLDRKNYQDGRTHQTVVNGQIALAQEFQDAIQSADPDTFDPDELLRKGREFTNKSVNNIYDSTLPNDLKEQLYNAQLKENASYMGMVDTKIKQITADNATKARVNSTAILAKDLATWDAEGMQIGLEAWIEKRTLAARAANPEKSLEDIQSEVGADLKSALTFNMDSIKASGNPSDLQQLAVLNEAADRLVDLGLMDGAIQLQQTANQLSTDIHKNQYARRSFEVQNRLDDWLQFPENRTKESLKEITDELRADESIDYVQRMELIGKLTTYYAKEEAKILNAEVVLDPRGESISSYLAKGKSDTDFANDVLAEFLKEDPKNPAIGAIKAMNFFSNAPEYSATGVQKSSSVIFSVLAGHARMSDAEVAADEYSDIRKEQFAITAQLYNKFKSENVTKANDLLSGIPDEYVDAFSAAFETGKTLEDVRKMFQNPVSTQEVYAGIEKATSDTAGLTKALGLGNEIIGSGYGGTARASMSDGVEPFYANEVITAIKGSKAFFAGNSQISTPTSLVSKFAKNGGLLPSPNGYSHTIMDLGVAKQVQNFKVTGTNTPLSTTYFARAIDAERQTLAKQYNVSPSNVVVKSDATGQQMHFQLYKSKGIRGKSEPELISENSTNLARLKKNAETLYEADMIRKRSPQGQEEKYMNTKIGEALVGDLSTGRQAPMKVNAGYARATGGNLGLATLWVSHMQKMENFTSGGVATKDANTGRGSYVYGHGMTVKTLKDMGMLEEVQRARGNPQAMMDVQGKFVQKYYADINKDLAAVGLPVPTAEPYSQRHLPALMLVYDVKWHAGSTKGLAKAMNARSYNEGRRILQGLSTYNRSKRGSTRNRFMETALLAHYKSRGL